MSTSKTTAEQSVPQAMKAIDKRKELIADRKGKRPTVIGRSANKTGTINGSLMLDRVPEGFKCAGQMAAVINAYYDLLGDDDHRPIKIEDIVAYLLDNDLWVGFNQDIPEVITHYRPWIDGRKKWNYGQGNILIGSFS